MQIPRLVITKEATAGIIRIRSRQPGSGIHRCCRTDRGAIRGRSHHIRPGHAKLQREDQPCVRAGNRLCRLTHDHPVPDRRRRDGDSSVPVAARIGTMNIHFHLSGSSGRRKAPVPDVGSARAAAAHRTRPGAVWRDPSHGFADAERLSTPQVSPPRTGGLLQRHASCPCGGSCPRCRQHAGVSGLRMSEQRDPFERQADRVAEQIMQASPAVVRRPDAATPELPRLGRVDFERRVRLRRAANRRRCALLAGQAARAAGANLHGTWLRPRSRCGANPRRAGGGCGGAIGRRQRVHARTPHRFRCRAVSTVARRGSAPACPRTDARAAAIQRRATGAAGATQPVLQGG